MNILDMVCERVRLTHGLALDNRTMKQLSMDLGKTIGLGERMAELHCRYKFKMLLDIQIEMSVL